MAEASTSAAKSKFNLIPGEELEMSARPSIFAFMSMYVIALAVCGAHVLFEFLPDPENVNNSFLKLVIGIVDESDAARLGTFIVLMVLFTWINRMVNLGSSGKGYTLLLLFITLMPFIFWAVDAFVPEDNVVAKVLPEQYEFVRWGVGWLVFMFIFTFYFQRSFNYAITTKALVFKRDFLLSRSQRRVLYDNINDLTLNQGIRGTLLGYGTITPITASGIGMGEQSAGVAAGAGKDLAETLGGRGDDVTTKAKRGIIKMIFAVLTFQRSKRTVMPDPGEAFFGVRRPQRIYDKVSEQWSAHDPTQKMGEIKDLLAARVQEAQSEAELPPQE